MVRCLSLKEIAKLSFKVAVPFSIGTFCCFASLTAIDIVSLVLLILDILIWVWWHVIVGMCNLHFRDDKWCWGFFQMTIYHLTRWVIYSHLFVHFSNWVVSFPVVECWVFHFGYKSFVRYVSCKYLLSGSGLCLGSLSSLIHRAEVLNFNKVQLIYFFFHGLCFWYYIQRLTTKPKVTSFFFLFFFNRSFIVLQFTFRLIIHFELIFV